MPGLPLLLGLLVVPGDAPDRTAGLSALLRTIVLEALPAEFEDRRHWNQRTRVVTGLDIEPKGIGLRISKRERAVRHGMWRRTAVRLIDPGHTVTLRISPLRSDAQGRLHADLFVEARAEVEVAFEHWNYGVKLLNASSVADASLQGHAAISLGLRWERDAQSAPVLVLDPAVHHIGLKLPDLDVRKFGPLEGPAARELGDRLEGPFEELLQTQESQVRKQAQAAIERHRDDLRIDWANLVTSQWSPLWIVP
jgi:hypothetical protein